MALRRKRLPMQSLDDVSLDEMSQLAHEKLTDDKMRQDLHGLWMLPILTTFALFYGSWLRYLCNCTQHAGLQDNVTDFRLCTRTIF